VIISNWYFGRTYIGSCLTIFFTIEAEIIIVVKKGKEKAPLGQGG
jgi:hypothetical protein